MEIREKKERKREQGRIKKGEASIPRNSAQGVTVSLKHHTKALFFILQRRKSHICMPSVESHPSEVTDLERFVSFTI